MKTLLLILLTSFTFNASAGSRTILCYGKDITLEIPAKGPNPYPMDGGLSAKIFDEIVELNYLFIHRDTKDYHFTIFYQAENGLAAALEYIDGHHAFSVFNGGKLVERVDCELGF